METIIIDGLSSHFLFIMAIGGIYSERSGITNLAIEGLRFGAFFEPCAVSINSASGVPVESCFI